MSYHLKIMLAGAPSMNTADNQHWRLRQKERKWWFEQVWWAIHGKRPEEPLKQARVRITRRTHASRCPDFENLTQGGKYLLDALVEHGVLTDDNPDVIGQPEYAWEYAPRGEKSVTVEVSEGRSDPGLNDYLEHEIRVHATRCGVEIEGRCAVEILTGEERQMAGITTKELESHLRESKGKKLPKRTRKA